MRGSIRRVAFVGDVEVAVSEELRGLGFRVEQIESDSIVRAARELVRMRPTLVHARKNHLKVGLVAHLLNIPFVVQAGTRDVNGLTARAARMAERTLCGGASIREGLLVLGAPASSTVGTSRAAGATCASAAHAVGRSSSGSRTSRRQSFSSPGCMRPTSTRAGCEPPSE